MQIAREMGLEETKIDVGTPSKRLSPKPSKAFIGRVTPVNEEEEEH